MPKQDLLASPKSSNIIKVIDHTICFVLVRSMGKTRRVAGDVNTAENRELVRNQFVCPL